MTCIALTTRRPVVFGPAPPPRSVVSVRESEHDEYTACRTFFTPAVSPDIGRRRVHGGGRATHPPRPPGGGHKKKKTPLVCAGGAAGFLSLPPQRAIWRAR